LKRVLLDQGLPRSALKILKKMDWDALHTGDIGLGAASDREILDYARLNERVVVTLDSDFHSILAVENEKKPSVIRIRREGLRGNDLSFFFPSPCPSPTRGEGTPTRHLSLVTALTTRHSSLVTRHCSYNSSLVTRHCSSHSSLVTALPTRHCPYHRTNIFLEITP